MAYLFIVMARYAGLDAKYVTVTKDNDEKRVNHACAAVFINNKRYLVDPAYKTFDIKHKEISIKSDRQELPRFKSKR